MIRFSPRAVFLILFSMGGLSSYGFDLTYTDPTGFRTEFSKVADLPADPVSNPGTQPRNSRSGILQIGNELWFTTVLGGNYIDQGTITAYDLISGNFEVKYSFGVPIPSDGTTARQDGYAPYATPALGQGIYSGQIIFSTRFGGDNRYVNGDAHNGGAIGVFNPVSGTSNVIWSGDSATNSTVPAQVYSTPVYVNNSSGEFLYFLSNQGGNIAVTGTTPQGSVVKLNLSNNSSTVVASYVRPEHYAGAPETMAGRVPQGGMLQVEDKLYFASTNNSTLQVLDTDTDSVTTFAAPVGKTVGIYGTPIYDSERDAIYAISLSQGIYKWDINTGIATALPNSTGSGNVQNSGILFEDSIFYVTFATSEAANSYLYRYDLITQQIHLQYNLGLITNSGFTSSQSGNFSIVNENGKDVLYFLTYGGGVNGSGTLLKLEVTAVPEPSAVLLATGALVSLALSRRRRHEG